MNWIWILRATVFDIYLEIYYDFVLNDLKKQIIHFFFYSELIVRPTNQIGKFIYSRVFFFNETRIYVEPVFHAWMR